MTVQTPAEAKVMRAIVARESKKARAERREAEEAFAQRAAAPPSRCGWSTKPDPKRKSSEADRRLAEQIERNRARFREKHPDVAGGERALRKARAMLEKRWSHKHEGTAETHEHHSRKVEGAMARLYQSGAIDGEQLASAIEISGVVEQIGADVTVRTASLETRIDITRAGDGTFFEAIGRVRREVAYGYWRRAQGSMIHPILEMIADDIGVTVVAKRWRIHNRRAKKLLTDALDSWPVALGQARREVDPASLAAAQAGILG